MKVLLILLNIVLNSLSYLINPVGPISSEVHVHSLFLVFAYKCKVIRKVCIEPSGLFIHNQISVVLLSFNSHPSENSYEFHPDHLWKRVDSVSEVGHL